MSKNKKRINRFSHNGKDRYEKEAYKKFLHSKFKLDKTEEDPINLNQTDSSSFEENDVETPKVTKKSFFLKVKDWFKSNLVTGVIASLIAAAIIWIGSTYVGIKVYQVDQEHRVSTIERDLGEITDDVNKIDDLRSDFDIFKTEINKDIEFIKKILRL